MKPEVQHLIRLVKHCRLQPTEIQRSAQDVVLQTSGCADNDMRAARQGAAFVAHVHAAHAGGDNRAGARIQPRQFLFDLKRKFPCRRDDQRQRLCRAVKGRRLTQQGGCDGKAKAHGLA